jgi:hypothetical protein
VNILSVALHATNLSVALRTPNKFESGGFARVRLLTDFFRIAEF